MAVRKLGQILVDLGSINDDQLEMLVEEQSQSSGMIGRIAVNMGLISDEDLIEGLGEQFGLKTLDLEGPQLYRIVPMQLHENVLTLATCDPQNLAMQDEIRRFLGYDIRLVVSSEADRQILQR